MLAIGFANKFYTLWNISEERRDLGNGHSYIITHNDYIKNISFDKETALAQYPDAKLDETLKGHTRSWESTKEVWDNVDVFRFGKYKYEKINNSDLSYLTWYWGQIYGDHKEYVGSILKDNGYEIRTWGEDNQYLMSPEDLENERKQNEETNEFIKTLDKKEDLNVVFEYNPDEEGECRIYNIIYKFKEVRENYYNGFPYYLPVVNGKQKRIKNKNLVITDYNYSVNDNIITIQILDFKIEK